MFQVRTAAPVTPLTTRSGSSPKPGPGRHDSKWFLPSTIGFSLICLGIAFCFSFFWYFFCRQPPESWEEQVRQRETRAQIVRLNDRSTGDYLNVRTSSGSSHLPTYDSAVYNQPPPSYEEAIKIKDCSDQFVSAPASASAAAATTALITSRPES